MGKYYHRTKELSKMDKARRHELEKLKYKKRLERMGWVCAATTKSPRGTVDGIQFNFTSFRTSSMCSGEKYKRAEVKVDTQLQLRAGRRSVYFRCFFKIQPSTGRLSTST